MATRLNGTIKLGWLQNFNEGTVSIMTINLSRVAACLKNPLDTAYKRALIHVRFHTDIAFLAEGIHTTEVLIHEDDTYEVRNYSLRTLEDMATVARAADLIRELGLKPHRT